MNTQNDFLQYKRIFCIGRFGYSAKGDKGLESEMFKFGCNIKFG